MWIPFWNPLDPLPIAPMAVQTSPRCWTLAGCPNRVQRALRFDESGSARSFKQFGGVTSKSTFSAVLEPRPSNAAQALKCELIET